AKLARPDGPDDAPAGSDGECVPLSVLRDHDTLEGGRLAECRGREGEDRNSGQEDEFSHGILRSVRGTGNAVLSLLSGSAEKSCESPSNGGGRRRELPSELDEERLQRERRVDVELLERPPRLADELRRALGSLQPLHGPVLPQLVGAVEVRDRLAGACGHDYEVAIPR